MNTRRVVATVARKDLRVEWNSRIITNQIAPFAGVVMVLFAFALDNDGILQRVAPGLVWLAVLFSMLVVVQHCLCHWRWCSMASTCLRPAWE